MDPLERLEIKRFIPLKRELRQDDSDRPRRPARQTPREHARPVFHRFNSLQHTPRRVLRNPHVA
jgi:hypothetical protein